MQVELLSHPIPPHQLLVHMFDRQRALGASLIVTLDDGKATPVEKGQLLQFNLSFELLVAFSSKQKVVAIVMEINVPAQFNHLCVVILEVVLPADSDAVGRHS